MKILLGLMAFFMLPSVTGLGSGIGNAIAAKNNTQDNVAFSPEAYHESNYYSIDLVADGSLSYPSNDVRLICRTTGYSHGVEFSVGGYYYLTSFHVLDDGTSYELRLTPRYSFENAGTTITATQYDSRSGQDIIRSEAFYSAWREDYISLSTTSMEHASDCADLEAFTRHGLDQSYDRQFFTYWNEKNNSRTDQFVRSNPINWRDKNIFGFYLRNGTAYEPLRYVNVGAFTSLEDEYPEKVYLTNNSGHITVPNSMPVQFFRVMSCSINHFTSDAEDPDDPKKPLIKHLSRALDQTNQNYLNNDNYYYPHGVALYRAKDKTGMLSMYYKDFFVESGYAMDFYIDGTDSSSFGKAMKIIQTLAYGKKYVEEMSGDAMGASEVYNAFYPCSGSRSSYAIKGSHWNGVSNVPHDNMYISEEDYANPDVILHEFGHCVQRKYGFGDSLGVPHYFGVNNANLLNDQYDEWRLAWGEAWPTVFANLITQYYGSYFFGKNGTADSTFDSHDCSFSLEYPTVKFGQNSEEDIAAVLYDIFDTNDTIEAFDRLSCGHEDLWNLMVGASQSSGGLKTFSEFLAYYQSTQSSDNNERLQNILREYGFTPDPTISVEGTITSGPILSWNAVSGAYRYDIALYDGYGALITTRVSTLNYYGIDNYDWKKILLSPTNGWYYEITANVMVNNNSYSYHSGRIYKNKPSGIVDGGLVKIDNTPSNRVVIKEIELLTNTTMQYSFQVSSDGYTTIQTTGPYGSKIELYDKDNNLVATGHGGSIGVGYGNNPRQKNGFIRYYCRSDGNYKILVRDCNSGRTYHGTLVIMQEYAYTKGSSKYVSADSLQEAIGNDCRYPVKVYKNKTSIFNYSPSSGIGTFTAELYSNFDTYLYVIDTQNGYIYKDDDSGNGNNAKVDFEASSGTMYLIMVTQYNPSNSPSNNDVEVRFRKK